MSKLVRAGESYLFNYKTPELELCLQEMVEVKNMMQMTPNPIFRCAGISYNNV